MEHGQLPTERALIDLRHLGVIGEGYGSGDLMLLEDLLERVAAKKIQFIIAGRALSQLQEVDIAASDTRAENPVGNEMKLGHEGGRRFTIYDLRVGGEVIAASQCLRFDVLSSAHSQRS